MASNESERWVGGSYPDAQSLTRPEVGRLLVAMPTLGDPTFDHTVVYLVSAYDAGFQGVIINESTREDVMSAVPEWWQLAAMPRMVHRGGPCEPDLVMCLGLGRQDLELDNVVAVHDYRSQTLYRLEGDVDPAYVDGKLAGVRLFRGYAGWSFSQLEYEIAEGAWLCVPSELNDVISAQSAGLWRGVLARQQGHSAFLRSCPANPERN
ncbi:putative transcriptional regulator [Antricoccus suffuscus]|uniref:Putative transcriptional regulator n=1 Tax=Antricoccus suffuscus TaxID=1629062 RepID=A0A2T1A5J8_9ACTN|nr:YqgE/AlgH family protein [Antricoccus suffuscus]PRZ43885.1 putative transcriptional regulator [Antricoccus suffuscus]